MGFRLRFSQQNQSIEDGNGWVSPLVSQPGWLPAVDGIDLAAQEKS